MSTTATKTTLTVTGMTCGGCAGRVQNGISAVPGVTNVDVDVASGRVTVDSSTPVERTAIVTAVDRAGYKVAD